MNEQGFRDPLKLLLLKFLKTRHTGIIHLPFPNLGKFESFQNYFPIFGNMIFQILKKTKWKLTTFLQFGKKHMNKATLGIRHF